jgi:ArsR family transcriptional regulator
MKSAIDVQPLSELFKALSDENRLRVVALLTHGELCVCHIESALGLPQPTTSRHLATLKSAGVVEARRQGSWIHYRLAPQADDDRNAHLRTLIRSFSKRGPLSRDLTRLQQVKGPDACR